MNDEHIAHRKMSGLGAGIAGHEKGDGQYVLSREPDIIQFGSSLGQSAPGLTTDRELYNSPKFHEMYRLASFYIPMLKNDAVFYLRI